MLVDTHCHLADPAYDADRAEVLARAWSSGVDRVIAVGETPAAARLALALAAAEPRVSVAVGVHPHDAVTWSESESARIRLALAEPAVVALGEIGLDYHYDHSPRPAQRAAFEAQLDLARATGKPVVIHAREADEDVAAVLRAWPDVPAVLHSFSSGPGLLRAGLDLRHYVSFSGMVTFKNWRQDEAVLAVPLDRILVETDGPYLAPVPHRGRRNEPALVRHTAERIAAVRGLPFEALAAATSANAGRLFRLPTL